MNIYICGDSFSSSDVAHGPMWVDLLEKNLPSYKIINLSLPGASNYLIYLQVKSALENGADHIIYQATSSIRLEFSIREDDYQKDSLSRYYDQRSDHDNFSMVYGSWHNFGRHLEKVLSIGDLQQISNFASQFVDLPNAIEKNYIYILHTLELLSKSNVKSWAWNRGGFEHKSFHRASEWNFTPFEDFEVTTNLWDYYDSKKSGPIYHVTDQEIHQKVCDHYIKMLKLSYKSDRQS